MEGYFSTRKPPPPGLGGKAYVNGQRAPPVSVWMQAMLSVPELALRCTRGAGRLEGARQALTWTRGRVHRWAHPPVDLPIACYSTGRQHYAVDVGFGQLTGVLRQDARS